MERYKVSSRSASARYNTIDVTKNTRLFVPEHELSSFLIGNKGSKFAEKIIEEKNLYKFFLDADLNFGIDKSTDSQQNNKNKTIELLIDLLFKKTILSNYINGEIMVLVKDSIDSVNFHIRSNMLVTKNQYENIINVINKEKFPLSYRFETNTHINKTWTYMYNCKYSENNLSNYYVPCKQNYHFTRDDTIIRTDFTNDSITDYLLNIYNEKVLVIYFILFQMNLIISHFKNSDDYDYWIKTGMLLITIQNKLVKLSPKCKEMTLSTSEAIWIKYSKKSTKYNENKTLKKWENLNESIKNNIKNRKKETMYYEKLPLAICMMQLYSNCLNNNNRKLDDSVEKILLPKRLQFQFLEKNDEKEYVKPSHVMCALFFKHVQVYQYFYNPKLKLFFNFDKSKGLYTYEIDIKEKMVDCLAILHDHIKNTDATIENVPFIKSSITYYIDLTYNDLKEISKKNKRFDGTRFRSISDLSFTPEKYLFFLNGKYDLTRLKLYKYNECDFVTETLPFNFYNFYKNHSIVEVKKKLYCQTEKIFIDKKKKMQMLFELLCNSLQ